MKIEELKESEDFDLEKVTHLIQEVEKMLSEQSLNVGELLLFYGNLGYKVGANLRRELFDKDFKSEPPDTDLLNQLYYASATPDVATMLTGLHVISWVDDL